MAQTAEPETVKAAPVEQAAQAPVQPVKDPASDVLESDVLETALDLDDPALLEALEAREKANRAIAEAVAAQREKQAVESIAETEISPKKSLFPTSADEAKVLFQKILDKVIGCLLYTSPSPRDATLSRMPSSA